MKERNSPKTKQGCRWGPMQQQINIPLMLKPMNRTILWGPTCLSTCICLHRPVCPPVCLSACLSIVSPYVFLSAYQYTLLSVCLPFRPSVSLYVFLSAFQSTCLSVCLSAFLLVHPSVPLYDRMSSGLSACLSVCLPVCLSSWPICCPPACQSTCVYFDKPVGPGQ